MKIIDHREGENLFLRGQNMSRFKKGAYSNCLMLCKSLIFGVSNLESLHGENIIILYIIKNNVALTHGIKSRLNRLKMINCKCRTASS